MKFCLLTIFLFLFVFFCQSQQKVDLDLEQNLMWNGNNQLALNLLKSKLKKDSSNTEILASMALAYYNLHEEGKSDSLINMGLKQNKKDPYFNEVKGVIFIYKGQYAEASKFLERAYKVSSNDHNILYNLALSYDKQRMFKKAIKYYSLNVNDGIRNFDNRGRCYMLLGDYEKALIDFNYVYSIDSSHVNVITNRATLYIRMEKFDLALIDVERALILNPGNDYALRLKSHIEEKLK